MRIKGERGQQTNLEPKFLIAGACRHVGGFASLLVDKHASLA